MISRPRKITSPGWWSIGIECVGEGLDELLVEFLNALLSSADIEEMAFSSVTVDRLEQRGGSWSIGARARGVPRRDLDGRLNAEVKAANYCGAFVRERGDGAWEAGCVVDL